ncbi:hypothetical protein MYX84_14255 [Acidobacteria bacterium AH-259-O06]|nr:hypothetical protein [Acidobacteria bacterium AH-259-O06]
MDDETFTPGLDIHGAMDDMADVSFGSQSRRPWTDIFQRLIEIFDPDGERPNPLPH